MIESTAEFTTMAPAELLDVETALGRVDRWSGEGRAVKVAISQGPQLIDSGWGGVQTDGAARLRLVYRRDSGGQEIDETIDVSASAATASSIWNAAPDQQAKFGHFDETIAFTLPDGRTILVICAASEKHADN